MSSSSPWSTSASTTGTHRGGELFVRSRSATRTLAICVGVVLGGLAGVVLAGSLLIDTVSVQRSNWWWIEPYLPYLRLAGVAFAGLLLAAGLLIVGIGVGRWRHPVPSQYRRSPEVRW